MSRNKKTAATLNDAGKHRSTAAIRLEQPLVLPPAEEMAADVPDKIEFEEEEEALLAPENGQDSFPIVQKSARIQPGVPVVGNEAVPLEQPLPDSSWGLERLAVYAKGELASSAQAEQAAILQAHKSAVHLLRAGCALAFARDKCKAEGHGIWANWKREHDMADTSVNDAIRLYENAKTEEALTGMGITQAKEKYVYPTKTQGDQPPTEGSPRKKRSTKKAKTQIKDGPMSASGRTVNEPSPDRHEQDDTNLTTKEESETVNGQVAQQCEGQHDESTQVEGQEPPKLPQSAYLQFQKQFGLVYSPRELMYQVWYMLQVVAGMVGTPDWPRDGVVEDAKVIPEMRDYLQKIEDAGPAERSGK